MNIFDKTITTKPRAPRITIYGKPGIGKTSLAAQFPRPYFLFTEDPAIDGLEGQPVQETFEEFWKTLKAMEASEVIDFDTLVIDSVSKLDDLIVRYIIDEEPANITARNNGQPQKITTLGSAAGGYGKGYERAQRIHRAVKVLLDKFTARGIGVVLIAHLHIAKYKAPDCDDYDVYSIVMNHDKSREVYIDDVDAVLFGRLKSFTDTLDSGKTIIKSTDKRVLVTSVNDVNVAKNRYSMPPEILMEFEELRKHIPFYNQNKEVKS